MNKEFVSYEIAVKLKKLGYDETCIASWNARKGEPYLVMNTGFKNSNHPIANPSAPLWQQVFDWLYDKHKIWAEQFINMHPDVNKIIYSYRLYEIKPDGKAYGKLMVDGFAWTPEELREKIILKAIVKITESTNLK